MVTAQAFSSHLLCHIKIKNIENEQKYDRIKEGMKKFGLDGLVISGGDDSGSVMVDLSQQGVKCVHAPKTMDLDLQSYSVGFDSTVNRIASLAEDLKTTARTHNRILVMEVFGRYAGHTAFRAGIAAEADACLIPEIPTDFDVLYEHCKKCYMHRVTESDVNAGYYLILVAEGLRDASGKEIVDEGARADAFGHKKLAGAGKFVSYELTKRFESDDEIKKFMEKEKMFVEGLYEFPEVRQVAPGHLVRCGHTSVFDVNFGKAVGASAVLLLKQGITGVTVIGVNAGKIQYQETSKVIKQRYVSMADVLLYEKLGVCFGRHPATDDLEAELVEGPIERFL